MVNEEQEEEDLTRPKQRHINWRSVWHSVDLDYAGVRLGVEPHSADSSNLKLADFGICTSENNSSGGAAAGACVRFVRRKFQKERDGARRKARSQLMTTG